MQGQEEKDTKKIALPRYFELNCYTDYMEITRTWFSVFKFIAVLIFGLVFSGVWIGNGFLEVLTSDRDLLLKLFALTFIILGSSLLYYSIAIYFNKTQILVSQDAIEIKHRPIPWLGNKRVETKNIEQLFVKKIYGGTSNNNPRFTFNVLGLAKEGEPIALLAGFETSNQALYIEQEIEKYLGIENVKVSGEIDLSG